MCELKESNNYSKPFTSFKTVCDDRTKKKLLHYVVLTGYIFIKFYKIDILGSILEHLE